MHVALITPLSYFSTTEVLCMLAFILNVPDTMFLFLAAVKYCLSSSEDESGSWESLGKKKTPMVVDDDDSDDDLFVPEPKVVSDSEQDSPVRPPP